MLRANRTMPPTSPARIRASSSRLGSRPLMPVMIDCPTSCAIVGGAAGAARPPDAAMLARAAAATTAAARVLDGNVDVAGHEHPDDVDAVVEDHDVGRQPDVEPADLREAEHTGGHGG